MSAEYKMDSFILVLFHAPTLSRPFRANIAIPAFLPSCVPPCLPRLQSPNPSAFSQVRVYDLKVNKHEPVGETRVNKKSKLTHVSFSPISPIICVGDDRGVVTVLKLSANLRRMSARSQKELDTVNMSNVLSSQLSNPAHHGNFTNVADLSHLLTRTTPQPLFSTVTVFLTHSPASGG
jgi:hypothetical protein